MINRYKDPVEKQKYLDICANNKKEGSKYKINQRKAMEEFHNDPVRKKARNNKHKNTINNAEYKQQSKERKLKYYYEKGGYEKHCEVHRTDEFRNKMSKIRQSYSDKYIREDCHYLDFKNTIVDNFYYSQFKDYFINIPNIKRDALINCFNRMVKQGIIGKITTKKGIPNIFYFT